MKIISKNQLNLDHPLFNDAYDAIQELALDPFKFVNIQIFQDSLKRYINGELTRKEFQDNCEKINIFNDGKLVGSILKA